MAAGATKGKHSAKANYVVQIVAKVKVGEHSLDASVGGNLDGMLDSAAGGGNPIFS